MKRDCLHKKGEHVRSKIPVQSISYVARLLSEEVHISLVFPFNARKVDKFRFSVGKVVKKSTGRILYKSTGVVVVPVSTHKLCDNVPQEQNNGLL